MFISCTNFRTIEVVDRLESEVGKPVISSNTATFWMIARTAGIDEAINGFGELLRL